MDEFFHTHPNSWLSPLLESRTFVEKGGHGIYAIDHIPQGTLLGMFGGTVLTTEQIDSLSPKMRSLSIQIDDDLYLVSLQEGHGDHFNHSCDPNAGMMGQCGVVAMRDIEIGEEVTFDYAMSDSSNYDEFECACDTNCCRGRITGDDWQLPELWEKYDGYFSAYLQRKINQQRQDQPSQIQTYAQFKSHGI